MLKKTIEYTDYNGEKRIEDFYFNLNEVEISELQLSEEGGFTNYVEKLQQTKDTKEIFRIAKELILKTYGEKSPDGKRFIKSDELSEGFSQTEAFVKLFTELGRDDLAMINFIKGVMPANVQEEINKLDLKEELERAKENA